jgi:penicillin G amidase
LANPFCIFFVEIFFRGHPHSMKFVRFALSVLTLAVLAIALTRSFSVGTSTLPPLGAFFNPFNGFWRNAEPMLGPHFNAQINIPNLTGAVTVVHDDLLVPHIYAQSAADAARVQGYVTAQHRLFQMDLTARSVAGRLSEVIGPRTLETDQLNRRRGMAWAAERDLEAWKKMPEGTALLEAYADGVNAYIAQMKPHELPIEYKLMNFKPEPWSVYKCALVIEGMADKLAVYDRDAAAANALALVGSDMYAQLYPHWNPLQTPVVPTDLRTSVPTDAPPTAPMSAPTGMLDQAGEMTDPPKNGSNNWAVSGRKTATGHPMLANDPHLSLTLPSIWFEVHVHTPQSNVRGVSLPGLPGVVIGFNEQVAWGITNVGADVTDWYKIKWTDATRRTYIVDGQAQAADLRIENILVKGSTQHVDTVRYTRWGPVVHTDPTHAYADCAYRWLAHDTASKSVMMQFLGLNTATTTADYDKALVGFDCPAQNFVFASQSGDIAIRVQGRFPTRSGDQGRYIRDGSTAAEDWTYRPDADILRMHNPQRGFVYSANQHSTDPSSPIYTRYGDWEQYRSRRISERLTALKGITMDSMIALQTDNFSRRAAEALPAMLRLLDRSGLDAISKGYVAELERWDYRYEAQSVAASLFEMWYDTAYYRTWDEMEALRIQKKPILFPEAWRFIELLQRDTLHPYFDVTATPEKEAARQVVTAAFGRMAAQAAKESLAGTLEYGKYRRITIPHLARIPAFGRFDVRSGGHRSAPNAITNTIFNPRVRDHGPSWRMIVDLGDEVRGIGIYPGGQSGSPGSRFYDNMLDQWAAGQYHELRLYDTPDAVEKPLARQEFRSGK